MPEEAAEIRLEDGTAASMRLIDCVGYMVPGAEGIFEDGEERMVTTPWFEGEIPITQAAEEGTRKVIAEHSTIGLVVTTDGTFGDIPRESYIAAEERVITELRGIGKPFAVIVNSAEPASEAAQTLAAELSERPFFLGVQYHPEFKSRPNRPHPLFIGFVEAAAEHGKEQGR